jgi:hypothetical protein
MSRREAEQFEEMLRRGAEGKTVEPRLASLVETARRASTLAAPPPPPPHRLAPGRQRLLAEAVRLQAKKTKKRKERVPMTGIVKLETVLIASILVFGLMLGVGQVMADSLPGEPLYGLKLAVEEVRIALTTAPQARADLSLTVAEERLDEVEALLEQQKTVDHTTAERLQQQLDVALRAAVQEQNAAASETLQKLALSIQQRQRTMEKLAGASPEEPLRQIMREMERVREEARAGAGDPDGLRQRLRHGTPPVPTMLPNPSHTPEPKHTPTQGEPQRTDQPGPQGPHATDVPGPGPQPTMEPGGGPGPGPQPSTEPGVGPGPGPQPTTEPGGNPDPGPQPTHEPGGNPDPGPQPTTEPGGNPDPGSQPTTEPGGNPDPGPQPTHEPGGDGSQQPGHGPGTGNGQKP